MSCSSAACGTRCQTGIGRAPEPADVGRDCSSSDEDLGSGTELDLNISWVRTSRHTEGAFEPYDEKRVLGNVCVTIQFVL
jgi:hypothetical protein